MTLGKEGAIVFDKTLNCGPRVRILSSRLIRVGAGDAFISGLAASMVCDLPIDQAAIIGNLSATICITKLYQTGNPTLEEVTALAADPEYRYHPQLAEDVRLAAYLDATDVEVITDPETIRRDQLPDIVIFDP